MINIGKNLDGDYDLMIRSFVNSDFSFRMSPIYLSAKNPSISSGAWADGAYKLRLNLQQSGESTEVTLRFSSGVTLDGVSFIYTNPPAL